MWVRCECYTIRGTVRERSRWKEVIEAVLQPRSQGLSSSRPSAWAGRWQTLGTRLAVLFFLSTGETQYYVEHFIELFSPYAQRRRHPGWRPVYSYSRKVVGKSARDNPERYCGWFWVHRSSNKFERMAREAMDVCFRVLKESNKSRFDSYSVRNSVLIISQITFRNFRVHIFSDNLSRNSCINIQQGLEEYYWIPGIDRNGERFREEGKFLDDIWDLTTTREVGFAKFLVRDAVYWKDCPRSPCKLGPEGPVCKPSSPSWKYALPSLSTANRDFKIWGRNGRKTLYKKWICVLSVFIAIIFTHLLCQNEGEPSRSWIPENRVQVQKEK